MIINMLKKMNNITWFPYNFSLNVLKNVKEIDRVEFLWGITICENVDNKSLEKCCARIKYIRDQNKDLDIMMSNEKHSKDYVDSLNNEFSDQLNLIGINSIKLETFLNLGKNDFVYFAKHMEQIFPDKIKSDKTKNKIILIE